MDNTREDIDDALSVINEMQDCGLCNCMTFFRMPYALYHVVSANGMTRMCDVYQESVNVVTASTGMLVYYSVGESLAICVSAGKCRAFGLTSWST